MLSSDSDAAQTQTVQLIMHYKVGSAALITGMKKKALTQRGLWRAIEMLMVDNGDTTKRFEFEISRDGVR